MAYCPPTSTPKSVSTAWSWGGLSRLRKRPCGRLDPPVRELLFLNSSNLRCDSSVLCRNIECAVSIPPSIAWAKLHSCVLHEAQRWLSGTCVNSKSGISGRRSGGPMYVQSTPACSATGYDLRRAVSFRLLSFGSVGASTHWPVTSYFQP